MNINFNPNQTENFALQDQEAGNKLSLFFLIKSFNKIVNGGEQCNCLFVAKKVLNIAYPIIALINLLILPFIAAYNCFKASPELKNETANDVVGDSQNLLLIFGDPLENDARARPARKNLDASKKENLVDGNTREKLAGDAPIKDEGSLGDVKNASEKENLVGGNAGENLIGGAPVKDEEAYDVLVEPPLLAQIKSESFPASLDAAGQIELLKEEAKKAPAPPARRNLNASTSSSKLEARNEAPADFLADHLFEFFSGQ